MARSRHSRNGCAAASILLGHVGPVKDFLTRVAERALGTAPRVDPQATSRYAPARLPLPEAPLLETPGRAVKLPRTSRAHQFDLEQAPSIEPAREEGINAPDQPRKLEPLAPERTQPAKQLDSEF